MPLTATFANRFIATFGPPKFAIQAQALLLLTELDAEIWTETSLAISAEGSTTVIMLTANRIGINTFRVVGALST